MQDDCRACIALIAQIKCGMKTKANRVYDFHFGRSSIYSVRVNDGKKLVIFDHNRGGYLKGVYPRIYDYLLSSYINIDINGDVMTCYDYFSGYYVKATVKGNRVVIFDYEKYGYFEYLVN